MKLEQLWTIVCAATAFGSVAFAGIREDFQRVDSDDARMVFASRCALMLPGGTSALKPFAGGAVLDGLSIDAATVTEARAFAVAQTKRNGLSIYCFSERSGRFPRELVIVPGDGMSASDAEVWDPQCGCIERPFTENGKLRIAFAPNEMLFVVWPDGRHSRSAPRTALPMRMSEPVGRETPLRLVSRSRAPVDGGAALDGASWIWHPDAKTDKGFATLRTVFDIPSGAKIDSAVLTFSIDNGGFVKINGCEAARQGTAPMSWATLSVRDVREFLKTGRNTIEAVCENIVAGDAGFLASLDVVADGRRIRVFTNDRTWEASLDGKVFKAAWCAGGYGNRPWLRFNESGKATQKPLETKIEEVATFDLGTVKPAGRLFLTGEALEDGKNAFFEVNGAGAGGFVTRPYRMDVTRFVKAGSNAIRILGARLVKPRLVWTAPADGPYDLRCEYLREPLGVVKPRLFWKYAGERPEKWKVKVWECGGPDTVRSGAVAAFDTADHLYVEPKIALKPFVRHRWRVEGRGTAAEGSFVSGIGKWRMPFFRPDWKYDPLEYWVARKRLELHGAKSVILSLATLGSHRLYVNGRAASAGFGPNRSHIEDGILLAATYDVTPLVRDGVNEIDVYVNDNWTGMRFCKERRSCLSVDGLALTEKGTVAIDSSSPWTVAKSCDRSYGAMSKHCNGRARGIERLCDVERLTDERQGVLRQGPAFNVTCDVSDLDWCIRELRPVSIEQDGNAWKIDMGEEFTGFMRLRLKGRTGTVAHMTVSDTFVDRCTFGQIAEFRFCGGDGVFENRLNWQSGRFFYLTGCERPEAEDVTGIVLSTVGRRDGDFRGDHDLETIRDLDNNTMTATTQLGVTVDCPHRERLGYGEASLSAMWGNMPFFDSAAYFYAYILKWGGSQEPSGRIPHTSPDGYGWGGTFWSNFPVYSLWEYTRLYPDRRLVGTMRPVVDKWLDYLHSHVREDGILGKYEPGRGDCLGDWLYPEIHFTKGAWGDWGDTVEGMFFNNCSYAWAIVRALETPGLVTDPARRAELKRRHGALVKAIDREWYRDGIYVSEDARYQSIALLCGAAEAGGHHAETERATLDIVERKGYVDGGSPSYTVILRVLCMSRRGRELALRAFRRHEAPGFLFFADAGYNTIPEDWWYGRNSRGSMIHTCYTGPAGALMHGFAGLDVNGREVTVAPFLSDALPNFSAHTETLYGTVAVKVESRGDRRVVTVACPNGMKGRYIGAEKHVLRAGLNRFEERRWR